MITAPTLAQLRALAPAANALYLAAFADADVALRPHGVLDNPLRLAHFLAQILHETGGLVVLRESLRYTTPERLLLIFGVGRHSAAVRPAEVSGLLDNAQALAERVYGLGNPKMARELGNVEAGDGYAYRGNGPLQTTGRAAHAKYGAPLGIDLVARPELATDPRYSLRLAAAEWQASGCNVAADSDDVVGVTERVNGGRNGLDERRAWLRKTRAVWR